MPQLDQADVAAILETLRAEVRAQRATLSAGEQGTALSAVEAELHHVAEQLEITRVVSAHWPLEGRTPYQRAWVLVHKVVRRALQWYIPPIVAQQNAFNEAAARAIHLLIEAHAELRDQVAELRRQAGQVPPTHPPPAGEAHPEPANPEALPDAASTAPPPAPALRDLPARLDERKAVSAHLPLAGATPLTQARILAQKGVRQYLRWMINPIVEQQNAFNAALAGAAAPLVAADAALRERLKRRPSSTR